VLPVMQAHDEVTIVHFVRDCSFVDNSDSLVLLIPDCPVTQEHKYVLFAPLRHYMIRRYLRRELIPFIRS
jgi:hypothetical protein